MRNYPFYLLFFLLPLAAGAQEPGQYGVRLMTPLVFQEVTLDTINYFESARARLGVQLGAFSHWTLGNRFSLNGELNYTLMGYNAGLDSSLSRIEKVNYHYFGATLLPAYHAGSTVSIQLGASANYLFNSPPVSARFSSSSPRLDLALVAGLALRYDQLEIQLRYQHSLLPFTPSGPAKAYFRSMGLGLGYYFN